MELGDIFKILADYANFMVRVLEFRGLERFQRLGRVDPSLVSFFVVSVLISFLIERAARWPKSASVRVAENGSDAGAQPVATEDSSASSSDATRYVLVALVAAAPVHWLMLALSSAVPFPHGSVEDTINATLAFGAVQEPSGALLARLRLALPQLSAKSDRMLRAIRYLGVMVSFTEVAFGSYLVYAFGAIHGMSAATALAVLGAVLLAVILIVGVPVAYYKVSERSFD
jgi:hypothetical protein